MAGARDLDELHQAVADRLRSGKQVYTGGRRRLVELVAATSRPSTIPELVADQAGLPVSSVYRNLAVLEEAGVISRIANGAEHARFELAEDLTGHHHHLICTTCGRVDDFTVAPAVERTLDRALANVVSETGFVPDTHRLDLVGTCASCHAAS